MDGAIHKLFTNENTMYEILLYDNVSVISGTKSSKISYGFVIN